MYSSLGTLHPCQQLGARPPARPCLPAAPVSAPSGSVRKLRWQFGPGTTCGVACSLMQTDQVSKPISDKALQRQTIYSLDLTLPGVGASPQRLTPPAPLPPLRR